MLWLNGALRGMISIHTTAKVVTSEQGHIHGNNTYFNPHHREGGDAVFFSKTPARIISIHTTAKVVTKFTAAKDWVVQFQSTPPRRW